MAVAAAPAYFAKNRAPKAPRDLLTHRCIDVRYPTHGVAPWEFERRGRRLNVRVNGPILFNTTPDHIVTAALDGLGVAYLPEEEVAPHLEEGRLTRVLEDLVPVVFGLPPLLPEPPAAFAGFPAGCRCAADGRRHRGRPLSGARSHRPFPLTCADQRRSLLHADCLVQEDREVSI
jgi:hypothetical protein